MSEMSEPARPAEPGSHWAEATTDVIRHTDETREAVDPRQGAHDEHKQAGDELQQAIAAVAAKHLGAPRDVIGEALQRELEACGRWPQPERWLDAVASDLEVGQVYQVGS